MTISISRLRAMCEAWKLANEADDDRARAAAIEAYDDENGCETLTKLLDAVEAAKVYVALFHDKERAGLTDLATALSPFTE